ncbi:hypothetical protein GPALN_004468 [Globodera pallida]|nr:hypothetical protein GPALN_004468 [Globodera pallida]
MLLRAVENWPPRKYESRLQQRTEQNVKCILECTAILFKNTAQRAIYTSYEHLLKLVSSKKIQIIAQITHLLAIISEHIDCLHNIDLELRRGFESKLRASIKTRSYYEEVIDVEAFCSPDYTIKQETQSITLNQDYPSFNIDLNKSIEDTMLEMHNYFSQLSPYPSQWHFLEFLVQFAYSQCCFEGQLNLLSTSLAANRAIHAFTTSTLLLIC